ncbi:MAG: response regulator [Acidobacteriota bacterium]|nr:MAG: response regulator [Acidobacteriota bacterium]
MPVELASGLDRAGGVRAFSTELLSRRLLEKTLRQLGHEVLSTTSGVEAWQVLQSERTKLVIADWMMPQMDGLELVRRIRTEEKDGYIYTILLTSMDDRQDIIDGLTAGADAYVT